MSENQPDSLLTNSNLKDLTIVTFPSTLKLTSTNYLGWKTQIEAFLHGLDLYKYIDGTLKAPPPTVAADGSSTPHSDYSNWFRQDRLLFGALVGSLSPPIIPLITHASSSHEAWKILAATYASPSRGHIKQLQHRLKQLTKTPTQSITEYMQTIKTVVDELAILGKKMDQEDVNDVVLNGLDQVSYKSVLDSVHGRDNPISFHELHEKLINHELTLAQQTVNSGIHQPASVFFVQNKGNKSWNNPRQTATSRQFHGSSSAGLLPTPNGPNTSQSAGARPFLGKCQWCHERGHSLANCPIFKQVNPNVVVPSYNRISQVKGAQVNMVNTSANPTTNWLFDSGASHHVTNDLNNLSLHAPYDGTEELIIGDGSRFTNPATPGLSNQRNV